MWNIQTWSFNNKIPWHSLEQPYRIVIRVVEWVVWCNAANEFGRPILTQSPLLPLALDPIVTKLYFLHLDGLYFVF